MAIDLDGMAVLRAISANSDLFPKATQKINELAHKLASEKLTKNANLDTVCKIYHILRDADFQILIDDLSDQARKKLTKAIDPHHPDLASADSAWFKRQIIKLAAGTLEPAQKPAKALKSQKRQCGGPKKPRPKRTLSSKAMNAAWDGKNHD